MVKKVSNSKERLRELIMKMEITVEEPNSEQRLLLYMLSLLNEEGCLEALKRIEELTQLDKYKRD